MELTTGQQALLRRMIKLFGEPTQWAQCIEECAELIVVIRRYDRGRATADQVAEEVADVFIMAQQAEEVADVFIMAQQARQMIGPGLVDQILRAKLVKLQRYADIEDARQKTGLPPKWRHLQ